MDIQTRIKLTKQINNNEEGLLAFEKDNGICITPNNNHIEIPIVELINRIRNYADKIGFIGNKLFFYINFKRKVIEVRE